MAFNFGPELKGMANVVFSESTGAKSTFIDTSSSGSTESSCSEYQFDSTIEPSEAQFSEIQLLEHWKARSDCSHSSLSGPTSSIVHTELLDSPKCVQQDFSAASVVDTELLHLSYKLHREDRKMANNFDEPSLTISQPMTVAGFTPIDNGRNAESAEKERALLQHTLLLLKHSNEVTEKLVQEESAALDAENKMIAEEVHKMHERLDVIEEKLENEFELIANHSILMNQKLDKALGLEADYTELGANCAKLMELFPELDQAARQSTQNIALAENILNLANKFDQTSFPSDGAVDTCICKNTAEVSSAIFQLTAAMKAIDSNIWGSIMKNSEAARLVEDTMDHLNRIDRLYASEFPPMDSLEFSAYLSQQLSIISVQSDTLDCSSRSVSRLSVDSLPISTIKAPPPSEVDDCNETQVELDDDIQEKLGVESVLQKIVSQVKTALSSFDSSISSSDVITALPISAAYSSSGGPLLLAKAVKSETDLRTASTCQSAISLLSRGWSEMDRCSDSSNRSLYLSNKSPKGSTGSNIMDFEEDSMMDSQDSIDSASASELTFPLHTLCSISSMRPSSDVYTALGIDDSITDSLEQTQVSSSSSESVY